MVYLRLLRILSFHADLQDQSNMSVLKLKNIEYEQKEVKICLAVIALCFFVSLLGYILSKPGKRYDFIFESAETGKLSIEHRYLTHQHYPESAVMYAEELMLGPRTERFRLLFSPDTKIISCFVRENVLYINISEEALEMTGSCSDIKTGIELFRKNIRNNFGKINLVEMYIDNKSVYGYGSEDL